MKICFLTTIVLCATPVLGGQTRYFRRGDATPDLPLDHPKLRHTSFVEQVHVTGGHPDSCIITWITNKTSKGALNICEASDSSSCQRFTPTNRAYSFLLNPPSWEPGESDCRGGENYTNSDCFYTSGVIHSASIDGLKPGAAYKYTFEDDAEGKKFGFSTPPAVESSSHIKFAVVGDLGQTGNSSNTVDGIAKLAVGDEKSVDVVLFAGDLSYADGYARRWDTFARMSQDLFANTVTSYTGGNHEVSSQDENWVNYEMRYPNDHARSGSDSFLWYSYETGPAHVISLCSYAGFEKQSLQYDWLVSDLATIDRAKTPWVIAMWHTPWYTSNAHHPRSEGASMMVALEDLIHKKVDVVFNGHVHAYERTHPVYHDKNTDETEGGITYITIGDGGNREAFAVPWIDPQPEWSAIREFAYGFGTFEIHNATTATWKWLRNDEPGTIGDEFVFQK